MPYTAEISRANRARILFIVDQSGSMSDRLETGSKADEVATILNRTLQELAVRCEKDEGVADYFDIGVLGYGSNGPANALKGPLASQIINPISAIANNPVRVEDKTRKVSDGAGGLLEVQTKFPVWFEPEANGGTPMVAALTLAAHELLDWADAHPQSFPPIVIHLTDGESTDGSPEAIAEQLRQISTEDGEAVLMNVHVSGISSREIVFPDDENDLSDNYAKMLFRMSSCLQSGMLDSAKGFGYKVNDRSRAFSFNSGTTQIVELFNIGTRPANLR